MATRQSFSIIPGQSFVRRRASNFVSVAQAVCDFVSITWAEFSAFQNRSTRLAFLQTIKLLKFN